MDNIDVEEIVSIVASRNNISPREVIDLINHYEGTLKEEIDVANNVAEEVFLKEGRFIKGVKIYIPNLGSFLSTKPRSRDLSKILAEKS